MTHPRISVLMPVRNGMPYLPAAVQSILDQSMQDWELVVVDNGSSDGSAEFVARLQEEDGRVRLYRNEKVGVSHSLNFGLDYCVAPWLARMDADDVSLPDRLERQLAFVEANPDVPAVSCWAYYINAESQRVARAPNDLSTREDFRRYRERKDLIEVPHPGAFIRRDVLERIGRYRPEFEPAEDVDLWSRLSEQGYVLAIPEFLIEYRLHAGSVVNSNLKLAQMKREWVRACTHARSAGAAEPGWEAFQRLWAGASPQERLDRNRRLLADRLFRQGREDLAAGARRRGLVKIGTASLLRPMRAAPRIKRQVVLGLSRLARTNAS
jgi:glycosyltransferase involved in cell wall biosynthesis